jgi:hypothetical protein
LRPQQGGCGADGRGHCRPCSCASRTLPSAPLPSGTCCRSLEDRKDVQSIGLLIADELQLIGGDVGSTYEAIVSRTRYVSQQTGTPTRIVACSVSLANARDLGDWIGAASQNVFNFSPSARPLPLEVHLQSFNVPTSRRSCLPWPSRHTSPWWRRGVAPDDCLRRRRASRPSSQPTTFSHMSSPTRTRSAS